MTMPSHLRRYVVEQDYSRYTPQDQAVWRYIMRQLVAFLSKHAHPCYVEGLAKTGIEVDRIPEIEHMSRKLQEFGWRAVPVSGFIPPAAFMEMQSLGFLPIASDMRTIGHLMYTPAPDIVHEAAGHAPILVNTEFADYLKQYAQVARKAIISKEDMQQYEVIRILSDMKEDPDSTPEQIAGAEKSLDQLTRSIQSVSEAAILSRMNWWTAEYGLIGSLENPRIFGAGLLSSVGEARSCLGTKVKKIPMSLDCINYSYDITEPQPQLFVTPDFATLSEVLEQLADTMAFRTGGMSGLEKARVAETVNTIELSSGLQIGGKLSRIETVEGPNGLDPAYLQFEGPTQLAENHNQLPGHGPAVHASGFGTPVGMLIDQDRALEDFSDSDLRALGLAPEKRATLHFRSGVEVSGLVTGWVRGANGRLHVLSFKDCRVSRGSQVLFDPAWGTFDMAVGCRVSSVYGGPADREAYGETDDFVAKVIPRRKFNEITLHKHRLFQAVRDLREKPLSADAQTENLAQILEAAESDFPHEWLLRMEILELGHRLPSPPDWLARVEMELDNLAADDANLAEPIRDGLLLAKNK